MCMGLSGVSYANFVYYTFNGFVLYLTTDWFYHNFEAILKEIWWTNLQPK